MNNAVLVFVCGFAKVLIDGLDVYVEYENISESYATKLNLPINYTQNEYINEVCDFLEQKYKPGILYWYVKTDKGCVAKEKITLN